jgi:Uncharacterised protein family (UPF0183)
MGASQGCVIASDYVLNLVGFSFPLNYISKIFNFLIFQEILGDGGRAAIQTQGSMNNPFGPTFVYGYQNVAFEVKLVFILWSFSFAFAIGNNACACLHLSGDEKWIYCYCNSLPIMRCLMLNLYSC